jgi:hypothetical protein
LPTSQTQQLAPVLEWLLQQLEAADAIDDYELLEQILDSDAEVARKVTVALQDVGVRKLTRQTYKSLDQEQFEALLAALLEAWGLTLDAARRLFCVKLKWCGRRDGWRGLWLRTRDKVWTRLPARLRNRVHKLGPFAERIWDTAMVFLALGEKIEVTTALARLAAFLAVRGLDELCRCGERA